MATPEQQLREALEADDSKRLLRLCGQLDRNVTVTAGGLERPVAHHIAKKWYGLDCLKVLIDRLGLDCLECRNMYNSTPVHMAAQNQDEESMEFIYRTLGRSCFEDRGQHQRTAVHCAAENTRSNSALKWLVQLLGPDCLRVKDEPGNTAIHISALKQGSDSMELFKTELGPSCFHQCGQYQRTVIHWAAMNEGSNEALRWLIGEFGSEPLMVKDGQGHTAVHLAAWNQGSDSMEMMKEQLGSLAFMLKSRNGDTAVHFAALNTISNSALDWCVKDLGPRSLVAKNLFGRMPIHLAAQHQDEKSMEMAVNSLGQSCLTLAGQKQQTAVHYAAMNVQSNSALRWIVSQLGAECLKQPDADGNMALHLAAQHQHVDSLRFIRDSLGVSAFKLEGVSKRTMAHFAAESGRKKELMDWIVREIGPQSLLVPDSHGITPAHLAGYYE